MKPSNQIKSPFSHRSPCYITPTVTSLTHHVTRLHKHFYSPLHFPKYLCGIMISSGIVGYMAMDYRWKNKLEERAEIYVHAYNNGATSSKVALARKATIRNAVWNDEDVIADAERHRNYNFLENEENKINNNPTSTLSKRLTLSGQQTLNRRVTQFW